MPTPEVTVRVEEEDFFTLYTGGTVLVKAIGNEGVLLDGDSPIPEEIPDEYLLQDRDGDRVPRYGWSALIPQDALEEVLNGSLRSYRSFDGKTY